ncbi:MAG: fibronectin type III domain-containing protein [Balneola sp.]
MIFRLSLLLILITGFVLSCSTGPEFERDNENDPESKDFIPDSPDEKDPMSNIYINQNRDVILKWSDSKFETGYIISKQYSKNSDFVEIARLDSGQTKFIDTSGKISTATNYKIASFVSKNDSITISNNPLILPLRFEPIDNYHFNTGNLNLDFSWRFSRRDSMGVRYFDGFLIEINKSSIHDSEWEALDTLEYKELSNELVTLTNIPRDIFELRIRVSQIIFDHEDQISTISTSNFRSAFQAPSNVRLTSINEIDFTIDWNSPIKNYDIAILSSGNAIDTFYNPNPPYQFSYLGNNNNYHRVDIKLIKDDNISKAVSSNQVPVFVREPTITQIEPISETSLKIFWEPYSGNQEGIEKNFYIERKELNDSEFSVLDSVDGSQFSYTDNNLDPSKTYTYRLKSVLSNHSNERSVEYKTTINTLSIDELVNPGRNFRITKSENFQAIIDIEDYKIKLTDNINNITRTLDFNTEYLPNSRRYFWNDYKLSDNDSLLAYTANAHRVESRYILGLFNHRKLTMIFDSVDNFGLYYGDFAFDNDNHQFIFSTSNERTKESHVNVISSINGKPVSKIKLDEYSYTPPNSILNIGENDILICSNTGLSKLNIVTGESKLLNPMSCRFLKKETNGSIYYLDSSNLYKYDKESETSEVITQIEIDLNFSHKNYRVFEDLNLLIFSGGPIIKDLKTNKYSFINLKILDDSRFPSVSLIKRNGSTFKLFTPDAIYEVELIDGWSF